LTKLGTRLVSRLVMSGALRAVTESADHWAFLVLRSPLDWETGVTQAAGLAIKTGEEIELSDNLDLRLVKSKRTRLLLHWSDGGIVLVDLTLRRYSVIAPSALARQHMNEFKNAIKLGAASALITPKFINFLLTWPFLLILAALAQVAIQDEEYRHYLFGPFDAARVEPHLPAWYEGVGPTARLLYLLSFLAALAIGYVRLKSGGLRVWPNALTKISFLGILYRLRTEGLRLENWRQIATGVIIGVLIAVMTFWFAN